MLREPEGDLTAAAAAVSQGPRRFGTVRGRTVVRW